MKKSSVVSALILLFSALMLSGCIFPYWDDGYYEHHHHGGYYDDYRGGGYRDRHHDSWRY